MNRQDAITTVIGVAFVAGIVGLSVTGHIDLPQEAYIVVLGIGLVLVAGVERLRKVWAVARGGDP